MKIVKACEKNVLRESYLFGAIYYKDLTDLKENQTTSLLFDAIELERFCDSAM